MPLTIYPYLLQSTCWVFDDPRTGLKEEAFVLGMSEMISRVVESKHIPGAEQGFGLSFDDVPFDHDVELSWLPPNVAIKAIGCSSWDRPATGNWYQGRILGQEMVGWLCPALLLYFPEPPKTIYAKADRLPEGIDPIWRVTADDPRARRFVSAPGEFQG